MLFNLLFGSIMQNLTVFRASLQKKEKRFQFFSVRQQFFGTLLERADKMPKLQDDTNGTFP